MIILPERCWGIWTCRCKTGLSKEIQMIQDGSKWSGMIQNLQNPSDCCFSCLHHRFIQLFPMLMSSVFHFLIYDSAHYITLHHHSPHPLGCLLIGPWCQEGSPESSLWILSCPGAFNCCTYCYLWETLDPFLPRVRNSPYTKVVCALIVSDTKVMSYPNYLARMPEVANIVNYVRA